MEKITIQEPRNIESPSREKDEMALEVASLHQVSDGYHTIQELYDHRIRLFIALCKAKNNHFLDGQDVNPWRSKTHSDGSCIPDWFVLGIGREKGVQITYHLPMSYWEETNFAETLDRAPDWDGHTSADVLERLKTL
jgi:hypothetical protein